MAQRQRTQRSDDQQNREKPGFDQRTVEVARVTRVVAGGKRMRFRVLIVMGDHAGCVGYGIGKGNDVSVAMSKAVRDAEKNMISVPIVRETIPHPVEMKYGSANVLLKPAPIGSGIIAGGSIRHVLEVSGVGNVVTKMLGSKNKLNNVRATFEALKALRKEKIQKSSS